MSALRNGSRGWTGKLVLVLGGLACGLIVAELMVRWVAPQSFTQAFVHEPEQDPLHQPDLSLGLTLRPNVTVPFAFGTQVTTNSLGLRDREIGPKGAGELRILSLGDSYAMGYGVALEDSYGEVLERELNRRFPVVTSTVINAGVDGYATEQMLRSFERLHGRLQPDFILATFVAGNDVYDNAVFAARLRTGLNTPTGVLGRNSHVARLLLRHTFPVWFFYGNRAPDRIAYTVQLLRRLESAFREAQVPFLILVIPARHQIRPDAEPAAGILMKLGLRSLVFRQNERVIAHFRRDSIPFLDLWPALAAEDRRSPVSFAEDSHLNVHGHEVVAREVLARLARMLPPLVERTRPQWVQLSDSAGAVAADHP